MLSLIVLQEDGYRLPVTPLNACSRSEKKRSDHPNFFNHTCKPIVLLEIGKTPSINSAIALRE